MDKEIKKKNVKKKVNSEKTRVEKSSTKKESAKKTNNTKKTNKSEVTGYDASFVIPKQKSQTPIIVVSLLIYVVVVIIPIIFMVFLILFDLKAYDFEYVGNNIRVGYDEFMISNIETQYVSDNFIISGYINDLDDDLDYVEIVFELYDYNNVVVGEASAVVFDLDDDRTYKFNATYGEYDAGEVTGYKVKEIYYY